MFSLFVPGSISTSHTFKQDASLPHKLNADITCSRKPQSVGVSIASDSAIPNEYGVSVFVNSASLPRSLFVGFLTNERSSDIFTIPWPEIEGEQKHIHVSLYIEPLREILFRELSSNLKKQLSTAWAVCTPIPISKSDEQNMIKHCEEAANRLLRLLPNYQTLAAATAFKFPVEQKVTEAPQPKTSVETPITTTSPAPAPAVESPPANVSSTPTSNTTTTTTDSSQTQQDVPISERLTKVCGFICYYIVILIHQQLSIQMQRMITHRKIRVLKKAHFDPTQCMCPL